MASTNEYDCQEVALQARDGHALAATWSAPLGAALRGAVIIGGALGVPREYYGLFAQYLAQRGLGTLTFDYRGVGGSAPSQLRGYNATLDQWGRLDLAAAIAWVRSGPGRDLPLGYFGHSVGGQILGLAENCGHVQAALTVASQHGYWGNWPAPRKYLLATFWWAILPALTRSLGYCPSRRLGLGENLPAGVGLDWARWGRSRGYLHHCLSAEQCVGYRQFAGPLLAYSFADDTFAPHTSVARFLEFYPQAAAASHRHVKPGEIGAKRIGHFGYFRPWFRDTLWQDAADWMGEKLVQ